MPNDQVFADFPLEDGTRVRVEVPRPIDDSAIAEASRLDDTLYEAQETIESALAKVTPIATAVMSRIKAGLTTPANEVEVKFGLNLSIESGVIISKVGGGVNFEVTLKWQPQAETPHKKAEDDAEP